MILNCAAFEAIFVYHVLVLQVYVHITDILFEVYEILVIQLGFSQNRQLGESVQK